MKCLNVLFTDGLMNEWDGMRWHGMEGMERISKVSVNVFHTLWVIRTCIYLLIYNIFKNCHQHSYEFENLMSSWG